MIGIMTAPKHLLNATEVTTSRNGKYVLINFVHEDMIMMKTQMIISQSMME